MFARRPFGLSPFATSLSASTTSSISGTLAVTQAAQTIAATGTIATHGVLAITQGAQTKGITGTVASHGALAATQAAQTRALTGTVLTHGAVALAQGAQTIVATGTAAQAARSGTLAVTQAAQTVTSSGTNAAQPIVVPPEIRPSTVSADAGGFGTWFNLAFDTSARHPRRRHRTTELGRFLEAQVYRDEARATREAMAPDVAEAAAEIVADAVAAIEAERDTLADDRAALALVARQEAAYRMLMAERGLMDARRAFIAAIVDQAAVQHQAHLAMIERDDLDFMALVGELA